MVHCADVIDNLGHVIRQRAGPWVEFEYQHVLERAAGAFDCRALDCLAPYVHGNEQVGVGKDLRCAVETSDRLVGL